MTRHRLHAPMFHAIGLAAVLLVTGSACGGDDSTVRLPGPDGGDVAISVGDGAVAMGGDLDVPDWLPSGFPLPADLDIAMAGRDGDTGLLNGSTSATPESERDRLTSWFAGAGFEILQDEVINDNLHMSAVNEAGDVIDLVLGTGGLLIEMSRRDVTADRQDAAELIEGPGTAAVVLGDDRFELEGTCRIQGQSYAFEHYATDGRTTANFQLDAFTQPAQGTAFFMRIDGADIVQYTITVPTSRPDQPVLTAGGSSFSISGTFLNAIGEGGIEGSFAVTCG